MNEIVGKIGPRRGGRAATDRGSARRGRATRSARRRAEQRRRGIPPMTALPDIALSICPPMMIEFPDWHRRVAKYPWSTHIGCCVDGMAGVHRWFTPSELARLQGLGFHLVDATGLTPIIIGRSQIIGGSRFPLAYLPVVKWEIAA